ncbi:MAG: AAA family ATPase [Pleomorphochaeta sp.]|nr:nitrogenase iron protein NifH [Sphaerochaetaceae bacterium]
MKKIAIYGKGGIGKSTTTSNLSAALASMGLIVMQIGCDPKADSTQLLMNGKKIPSVLDQIKKFGDEVELKDIVFKSESGVFCVESGGPTPGIGCAGRGIITAFQKLEELEAFETYTPDVVLYDVLGDVVCGGFAMPIRENYADEVMIVTSAEKMAIFAARNIVMAIDNFSRRSYAKLKGVIHNSRIIENEDALVKSFIEEADTKLLMKIPRSNTVQQAELIERTVVSAFPTSEQAKVYISLAEKVMEE